MDYRLYILAGTFLLLIVALVTFIVTLVRSRRALLVAGDYEPVSPQYAALPPANARVVNNTSLEGLEVPVAPDVPSAALLAPIRTGEWMPPQEPAPAERLPDVSLAERVAEFTPAPPVPEPAFSVEAYPAWEVAPAAAESVAPHGVVEVVAPTGWLPIDEAEASVISPASTVPAPEMVAPAEIPVEPLMPVVQASEEQLPEVVVPPAPTPVAIPYIPEVVVDTQAEDDEFSAEIAALLPTLEPEPSLLAPEPFPLPVLPVEVVPVPVAPEPAPAPPAPEPVSAPELAPLAHEPAPPAPAPPAVTPAPAEELLWEDMLREQQGVARPVAVPPTAPSEPRPSATVAAAVPPVAHEPVPVVPAPVPRPTRPRARVRLGSDTVMAAEVAQDPLSAPAALLPSVRPEHVPDVVMAAPVEMWFGESRVGVKAGTATYDRFRKYADVLLGDLKATRDASR